MPDGDLTLEGEKHGESLPANNRSNVYEALRVVKSGPGTLFGFTVYSSAGADQFVQWHDSAVPPAAGAVPEGFVKVTTVTDKGVAWIPGRTFRRGIVLCNSSTGPTLTAGSADCFFDAQYI